jgi:hypothetical protein
VSKCFVLGDDPPRYASAPVAELCGYQSDYRRLRRDKSCDRAHGLPSH